MQPTNNGNGNGSGGGDLTQQQQLQQQQWLAMQQYQQQQWLAMQQYPAAAAASMAMHHPAMMYQAPPPHYMPYYQAQQYQQQSQQKGNQIQNTSEDNKTIWIGDLQHWMDESYLQSCFAQTGEQVASIKLIRNKQTGQSERYGFIEFHTHEAAEKAIQSYNGTVMPNTDQVFRLNWASFSTGEKRAENIGSDLSIFIGDLAPDVTDALLYETFAGRYPSVKGAKVVLDTNTGCSKGYGFVRFADENERARAMNEMNGQYCLSRPMRVGVATPKKPPTQQQYGQNQFSSQAVLLTGGNDSYGAVQSDGDSSNTTIFVGGLDSEVTDEDLRQTFSQCGEILSVKIPVGKGCGFVQFSTRSSAEDAIQNMHGTVIGKQTVRISWGKTPVNRQRMGGNGNYYVKQGYGGGGYGGGGYGGGSYGGGGYGGGGQQNQDGGMYGAADASAYGSNGYDNHQQSVS
ncbi:hypothetical protein SSX86_021066 [Deinandra increscens subsp. villosa]|uniref:RRM domain-containing protein n=1 Tax=Deinandra increscens subsp. villosa TaxID=3103831 RepID=A0AAP0CU75_9ASTR